MANRLNISQAAASARTAMVAERVVTKSSSLLVTLGNTFVINGVVGTVNRHCSCTITLYDKNGAVATTLFNPLGQLYCALTLKPVADGSAGEEGSGSCYARTWQIDVTSFATGSVVFTFDGKMVDTEARVYTSPSYYDSYPRGGESYQLTIPFVVENV